MDKIECLICNKKFKRITTTHLRHVHGISYNEYFNLFPDAIIESKEITQSRKQTLENMIKRYGQIEGVKKWNTYIAKQSETNSYEYKKKMYGWTKQQFDEYNKQRGSVGSNNGNYKKGFYEIWKEKYGHDVADKKLKEFKEKIIKANTGRKVNFSEQALRNMREGAIERIRNNGGLFISYNPNSIPIIEEYGNIHGYKFQHAENGGEYQVCGYFVDGYDKEKNVVIEYDEKHHFTKNGKLKESDKIRQQNIINELNCKFIRINYKGEITEHEN